MKERKRTSKWMLLGVVMIVLAIVALTGCSGNKGEEGNSPAPVVNNSTTTPKEDAGKVDPKEELEPVDLIWYMRGDEPANAASVMAEVNKLLNEKINATLEMRFISPGDYESKMQLVMSSSEVYDLAFTSNWTNNFLNNVSRGAYLPLNDLLELAPDVKTLFQPDIWGAVSTGGKIYGVPNNQIMGDTSGMWFKKDLVDKYSLDVKNVKSLAELTPIFETIKKNEPDVIPLRQGELTWFAKFSPEVTLVEGYSVDTNTWRVWDGAEDLTDTYKILREWNQKGFFPQDVATLKDENSLIKAGKIFSRYARPKPGLEAELKASHGFEFITTQTGTMTIGAGSVTSTISAISATSKNPERAMMLLNLVNTDKELYNMLVFGLEGQDYTKVGDNRIEPKEGSYALPGWLLGNVFNSYLLPGQADDVWEQTKKLNDESIVSPLINFTFDRTPVENEMAQISAVRAEFDPILKNGMDDPDKIFKQRQEKLKTAGQDKVIKEIEKQLAAWQAAR